MRTDPICDGTLILCAAYLFFATLIRPSELPALPQGSVVTAPALQTLRVGVKSAGGGTNESVRIAPPVNPPAGPERGSTRPGGVAVKKPQAFALVWDAEVKEYDARSGETNVLFIFNVTNTGPTEVVINELRTSCGCVVATLPEYPWRLAPGTNGQVQVIADLRGQRGLVHKVIYVHIADHGIQSLTIKVHIPDAVPGHEGQLRAAACRLSWSAAEPLGLCWAVMTWSKNALRNPIVPTQLGNIESVEMRPEHGSATAASARFRLVSQVTLDVRPGRHLRMLPALFMATLAPFAALRPKPDLASSICELPYDVVSSDEARQIAQGNPLSFLRVSKPEIDLPAGTDPYSPQVYAKGRENFRELIRSGALKPDSRPAFYLYRQVMGRHSQVGLVAGASCEEYLTGVIRKHELTRPENGGEPLGSYLFIIHLTGVTGVGRLWP
jgi:hypothetical protein